MNILVTVADAALRHALLAALRRHGGDDGTLRVAMHADADAALPDADDGAAAIPAIELALIDLAAPGDAVALCHRLRQHAGPGPWPALAPYATTPYIMVIADAETPGAAEPAIDAGADDVLPRAIAPDILPLRLRLADDRRALRRQVLAMAERLTATERRQRALLQHAQEGVLEVDADGCIHSVNARVCALTGFQPHELVGAEADVRLTTPDVRARLPGNTLFGTSPESYTLPLPHRSEPPRWVELVTVPLDDDHHLVVITDRTEQRAAEEALHHREQYFRALWENASDLITVVDLDGTILFQSDSSVAILGREPSQLIGEPFAEWLHPEERAIFTNALDLAIATEQEIPMRVRVRHAGGDDGDQPVRWRDLECLLKNLIDNPVVGGIVITARDRTEARRAEEALARERAFFQQLFRNAPTGIVILDNQDRVVDANGPFVALFGYALDELQGLPLSDFIVPPDRRQEASDLSQAVLRKEIVERESIRVRKDGTQVDVSILGYPIELEDQRIGAYGIYSDITQRKVAERKLLHEAFHDTLTGLPTRALLQQRLERALRHRARDEVEFALLFIDLDRFKVINDSLGHAAGDELLMEMAARLQDCLRPGDTVARLGGDEFTIILEAIHAPTGATRVAERILGRLSEPFHIAGQDVVSSGSIGIAFSATGYANPDDLMRDADIAMYRAKQRGKACYEVFDAAMHAEAVNRLSLETELRRAIDRDELVLFYQPVVSLNTGKLIAFEALIRWNHPEKGILSPYQIIPIAEETGLIIPIGRWVLRETCRQLARWQERFPDSDCLVISINLSVREISHPDFLDGVRASIDELDANPASIGLEITESLMMEAAETIQDTLWQLRHMGFRLSIDDFGTGYSSLASLHSFPINTLKIDRSFIQRMKPGGENLASVRTIAALGTSLGMSVIAEGVETEALLDQLRQLGIPYGQGYHFARPLPADEAGTLIERDPTW
ncbi:MAG: EAL domain-containing protein [Acidobacteriota bacterium]